MPAPNLAPTGAGELCREFPPDGGSEPSSSTGSGSDASPDARQGGCRGSSDSRAS
eukprot:CAMPEP_0195136668 /NCGR_PEP_ID=MMETSP0448-20130528/154632_1 /TAXON_ID=66468 /ORGANISM="Heterocapsa triquestra, Strain CCMP 448" /LENGTH=54 /DNA_ID=CAMNT_0040174865 /DNA_START=19 /DNA_END=179 /DNA_ORIENTATION=+